MHYAIDGFFLIEKLIFSLQKRVRHTQKEVRLTGTSNSLRWVHRTVIAITIRNAKRKSLWRTWNCNFPFSKSSRFTLRYRCCCCCVNCDINCNRVELVNGNDCITFVGFEFRLIENLAAANELSGCVNYFLTCRKSKFVFLKLHFYNALVMRGKANKQKRKSNGIFFSFFKVTQNDDKIVRLIRVREGKWRCFALHRVFTSDGRNFLYLTSMWIIF